MFYRIVLPLLTLCIAFLPAGYEKMKEIQMIQQTIKEVMRTLSNTDTSHNLAFIMWLAGHVGNWNITLMYFIYQKYSALFSL